MNAYRHSPLHSARAGRMLAGLLSRYQKALGKPTRVTKEINGITYELDLTQVIDSSLYYSGSFEPKSEAIMAHFLKAGMCALDIGANIGYHSLRMASLVAPGGQVHAIEPMSWAVARLTRNLQLNPQITNISIHHLALSDESLEKQEISFRASYRLDGRDELQSEKITMWKLDDFLQGQAVHKLDFIKMDVDGYEGKIFKGARETILTQHPMMLFEFNPSEIIRTGCQPEDLLNFLMVSGYQLFNDDLKEMDRASLDAVLHHADQSCMIFAQWA